MPDVLLNFPLTAEPLMLVLSVLTALALGLVAADLLVRRGRRGALVVAACVCGGALVGLAVAWLLGDVEDLFGVGFTTVSRLRIAALFAGVALAAAELILLRDSGRLLPDALLPGIAATPSSRASSRRVTHRGPHRGRRIAGATAALLLSALTATVGINADFGQYPTLRAALDLPVYPPLPDPMPGAVPSETRGIVGSAAIPARVSHFAARDAVVYVPSAARVPHPRPLPVIEMLSGQPGSPQDAFTAGHFALLLDRWAAAHAGIAPILVVPDQLGARSRNPMCVDSPLGNSATYLTVDVPAWIRSHFSVQPGPEAWTFAGYSQGGTCSAQLGGAHPELYGTILDIAGEEAPHAGSIPHTIASAFGGSAAAYAAAAPAAVLAAHAPYRSLLMILAAGSDDTRYLPVERRLAKQAAAAGAAVRLVVSPGTSHDWYTVRYAFRRALPLIVARAGSS